MKEPLVQFAFVIIKGVSCLPLSTHTHVYNRKTNKATAPSLYP